ncbi:hypothetical protein Micbo1qcDRAFT_163232 [Microdochium bolleyi]|uniref:Uncharacterized protein n=1 Tax=Microdochium bolleyi TaxID=196109 RepID=A0A136J2W8_9PEZI|nr:hypothetical protein Micbo1qcDRAFT_163232 [Microdochium bolleyi]
MHFPACRSGFPPHSVRPSTLFGRYHTGVLSLRMSSHSVSERTTRQARRRSVFRAQDARESQPSLTEHIIIDLTDQSSSPLSKGHVHTNTAAQGEQSIRDEARDHTAQQRAQQLSVGQDSQSYSKPQPAEEEGQPESIDDDDTCPICQLLLYDPVRTTRCGHTLCGFCMATWASVSFESPNPTTIVDIDEEPVDFDPVADAVEVRCPMCRTLTAAQPDLPRRDALREGYPRAYKDRELEVGAESLSGASGRGDAQTITLYIGNRHALVAPTASSRGGANGRAEANQHAWDFFVHTSRTDIIEEVHMHLHPTFRPARVVRQRPPYVISRLGWGVFAVRADVVLKAGYEWVSDEAVDSPDGARKGVLPMEWMLDFEGSGGRGSMARCRLKVKREDGGGRTTRTRRTRTRDVAGGGEIDEDDDVELVRDAREMSRMARQYERDGRYDPEPSRRRRRE